MSLKDFQRHLYNLDFDPGPIDGKWGPQTETAAFMALSALEPNLLLPAFWLPPVPMERVIVHWTAGGPEPTSLDLSHYHFLVGQDGSIHRGVDLERNSGSLKPGYAAHTLNCNTGSIGVGLCGMAFAEEFPFNPGPYPITLPQWEILIEICAILCRRYSIKPEPRTLLSHAEVQKTLGITQRGKWDITQLPFNPLVDGAREVGDMLRTAVKEKLK